MKTKAFSFLTSLILLFLALSMLLGTNSVQAAPLLDTSRVTPASPTDAKASLVLELPPGRANLSEYSLVRLPMGGGATPVPTEEPTPEATPRPRTDTDLQPPIVVTAPPADKEFFVIKTRNEKVFYLIIDRTKMSDNVYLVTEVDEADLLNFIESEQEPSLLPFLPQPTKLVPTESPPVITPAAPISSPAIPYLGNVHPAMIIAGAVLLLAGAGALFYWKVVKPKDHLPSEADFYQDDYLEDSSDKDKE